MYEVHRWVNVSLSGMGDGRKGSQTPRVVNGFLHIADLKRTIIINLSIQILDRKYFLFNYLLEMMESNCKLFLKAS